MTLPKEGLDSYFHCKTEQELKKQLLADGKCKNTKEFKQWFQKNVPLESALQKKILNYLKKREDCVCWKVHNGMYCQGGVPDIICIKEGMFYGFEVKRPWVGKPSALQLNMKRAIERVGGTMAMVSWVEEVKEILEK